MLLQLYSESKLFNNSPTAKYVSKSFQIRMNHYKSPQSYLRTTLNFVTNKHFAFRVENSKNMNAFIRTQRTARQILTLKTLQFVLNLAFSRWMHIGNKSSDEMDTYDRFHLLLYSIVRAAILAGNRVK